MADKKLSEGFKELIDDVTVMFHEALEDAFVEYDGTMDPKNEEQYVMMMKMMTQMMNLSAQFIEMLEATNDKLNVALDKYLEA